MVKCKYYKKCSHFRANSHTCQNGGDKYCGLYRRFELQALMKRNRKARKRAVLKSVLRAELVGGWGIKDARILSPSEAKSVFMLAAMNGLSKLQEGVEQ